MTISLSTLLVWIVVGLIAGWLAGKVMTGHGLGIIMDIIVGVIGAFLGGFIAGAFGFVATGLVAEIIVAFAGAVILLMILRLVGVSRLRRGFR
jgi:uncharacterized membrane protein YeaQ/YmgE (transglycosylase-associated protein family)